jgi:hypothetical protein
MGWTGRLARGMSVCLLCSILGCHRSAVQHKDPPDPLLISKTPVDGRPTASRSSSHLVRNEPVPPPAIPEGPDKPTSVQRDTTGPLRPAQYP